MSKSDLSGPSLFVNLAVPQYVGLDDDFDEESEDDDEVVDELEDADDLLLPKAFSSFSLCC